MQVDFHGGVLSQFYPYAETQPAPSWWTFDGLLGSRRKRLTSESWSRLTWKGVRLAPDLPVPVTDEKVWTAPRAVKAATLQVKFKDPQASTSEERTEAEHFLFYRGVGHLDSPVQLVSNPNEAKVTIKGAFAQGWLTEINATGAVAFTRVSASSGVSQAPSRFAAPDFGSGNLEALKASMQGGLVQAGLFPDEAAAMLKTWELSYFKSPGRRFFYLVPGAWVDNVLPLKIAGAPARVTRVMVGRVELITDPQREALARLAAGPAPDLAAARAAADTALRGGQLSAADVTAFYTGEKRLTDLGIPLTPPVQDYLSMGRFRDALIMNEQRLRPTTALARLIKDSLIELPPG